MAGNPTIRVLKDAADLAHAAAETIAGTINRTLGDRGLCSIALAGGETPRTVYHLLASGEIQIRIDWRCVHLFFGDERLVPPDDERSNFRMVREELLSHVQIPADNIRRIRGEMPPEKAAEDYRKQLKAFFRNERPRFDLILLGLGKDGHTASLFPGSDALAEREKPVVAVRAPGSQEFRATITLPVINNAHAILFLVSGGLKASILRDVLSAGQPRTALPATMVRPEHGDLGWMIDSGAATEIGQQIPGRSNMPQRGRNE